MKFSGRLFCDLLLWCEILNFAKYAKTTMLCAISQFFLMNKTKITISNWVASVKCAWFISIKRLLDSKVQSNFLTWSTNSWCCNLWYYKWQPCLQRIKFFALFRSTDVLFKINTLFAEWHTVCNEFCLI